MSYALFDHDNKALEDLMHVVNPDEHDIVLLGALSKRYPPLSLLGSLIWEIATDWGLTEYELNRKCRKIWASGYRPGTTIYGVGSANDTQEES